jgi:hypothetical protein
VIDDASASGVPLDTERLELAKLQLADDFTGVPVFPDWISFGNEWVSTLQGIILGDLTVEDGLTKGVEDATELFDSLGYYG